MTYKSLSAVELIDCFIGCTLPTNRGFNYYVDWNNIKGYEKYSIEIHALDVLIACPDHCFKEKFSLLLSKLPSVVALFPFLFGLAKAERTKLHKGKEKLRVIQDDIDADDHLMYSFEDTSKTLCKKDIEQYYYFFEKIGLKHLYQNVIEKSTWDYIAGVLVGMDSNGRKNRGGLAFELACLPLFEQAAKEHNLTLLTQKQFKQLKKYGFEISKDIANRKADFILLNKEKSKAINIEVNFYNGSGSKPEEIIDSYILRQNDLKANNIGFALVTDGKCWSKATNQLQKGFRHLDNLLNFHMLKHGMLNEIIKIAFD